MPRSSSVLTLALTGLLLAGCGGKQQSAGGGDALEKSFVEVVNLGFLDVNLYVVRSGSRVKLGTVSGNSTVRLEIPRSFVNPGLPVRFLADPIGSSRTPYSAEIPVYPGGTITLRIPPI